MFFKSTKLMKITYTFDKNGECEKIHDLRYSQVFREILMLYATRSLQQDSIDAVCSCYDLLDYTHPIIKFTEETQLQYHLDCMAYIEINFLLNSSTHEINISSSLKKSLEKIVKVLQTLQPSSLTQTTPYVSENHLIREVRCQWTDIINECNFLISRSIMPKFKIWINKSENKEYLNKFSPFYIEDGLQQEKTGCCRIC